MSLHQLVTPRASAVTIAEAAAMAGRSTSWIRTQRDFGPLDAVDIDGRQGVTVTSLRVLIAEQNIRQALMKQRRKATNKPRPAPILRLVIDNTK